MPRTISFLGSVALLVSNITGPSLVVIPLLYQVAGWFTPALTFAAIALLSGAAALFMVETMSSVEGNEEFQASIEFTTVAYLFLGKRWHIVTQVLLYVAMQSLVIASLLEAFQSMDAFLISVAHKTCAVSFTDGWVCVDQITPGATSAFPGYILGSFGTLITLSLIVPLSLLRLADNIIFQVASFIVLVVITIMWIVICAVKGLNASPVPVIGHNQSDVVGFVLSNFAFVMTIPAWVNETHPSVNIRLAVWTAIIISCLIYIPVGWMGGTAFVYPDNATLLNVLVTSTGNGTLSTAAKVSTYMFPLAVLITSIPVFTIVIRYNLLRGNMCSKKMAFFLSAVMPWLIAIPLQTNGALTIILNWASLIFTSPSNLLIPFIMLIVSKRRSASILGANVLGDPGMSLVQGEPTTAPKESETPIENTLMNKVNTDSTVDGAEKGMMKIEASNESEAVTKSVLNALTIPVMKPTSSPTRRDWYEQEVPGDGGGTNGSRVYVAFPMLSSKSRIRSTHISAVGFLLSAALVITALVYNIIQSSGGA